MEDFGQESDLGRSHRVVIREEKLEFKDAAYITHGTVSMYSKIQSIQEVKVSRPSYGDWDGP